MKIVLVFKQIDKYACTCTPTCIMLIRCEVHTLAHKHMHTNICCTQAVQYQLVHCVQNMTVSVVSSKQLVCLQLNLVC